MNDIKEPSVRGIWLYKGQDHIIDDVVAYVKLRDFADRMIQWLQSPPDFEAISAAPTVNHVPADTPIVTNHTSAPVPVVTAPEKMRSMNAREREIQSILDSGTNRKQGTETPPPGQLATDYLFAVLRDHLRYEETGRFMELDLAVHTMLTYGWKTSAKTAQGAIATVRNGILMTKVGKEKFVVKGKTVALRGAPRNQTPHEDLAAVIESSRHNAEGIKRAIEERRSSDDQPIELPDDFLDNLDNPVVRNA